MSQHKIKRLRSPGKTPQTDKILNSTLPTHLVHLQSSGLSPQKSLSQSDHAYTNLINQINKVYEQISHVRKESRRHEELGKDLQRDKVILEQTVRNLSKEVNYFKEMYELQVVNHQELRKFYEQRELEWKLIVQKHKQILLEYHQKYSPQNSSIAQNCQEQKCSSLLQKSSELLPISSQSIYQSDQSIEPSNFRKNRRVKNSSLQRQNRSLPRLKLMKEVPKEDSFYRQLSELCDQQSRFTSNAEKQYMNMKKQYCKVKSSYRDVVADDFFQKVIRTTYHHFKEKCMSVNEIGNLQDMKKLKSANTSTPQRLVKTLKKLNFQLGNEEELKNFCDYIQKAVIRKYKVFRGDYAFELLVQKLKECQKLALSSDSLLSKLDKEKSNVKDEQISFQSSRIPKVSQDYVRSGLRRKSRKGSQVDKTANKSIQLLLDSSIKLERSIYEDEQMKISGNISDSSYRQRSQLPVDSYPQTPQGSKLFKFRQREELNSEVLPE